MTNTLPPCKQNIYKYGTQVFLTHTIKSNHIEEWVKIIEKESNQQVDWHWAAGRAIILAIGDLDKVKSAIKNNRSIHDNYYLEAVKGYGFNNISGDKQLDGIWAYNGL